MPIYEYECTCGERFEKLVRMSAPDPSCPKCQGSEVRKLVSASAFVLKGGGWYRDHYGLKGGSGSSGSSGSSDSGSSGSGSSSSGSSSSGSSGSGSTGGSSASSASPASAS